MGKMHELLAVEPDRENLFKKTQQEAQETFRKRADHFLEHHKTLKMKDDDRRMEETAAEDHKEMVTTVGAKLDYIAGPAIIYLDALLQKEATNQDAVADLVLPDGTELGKNLPATFLLGLEKRLKIVRATYEAIPTLSPGNRWELDAGAGVGVYRDADTEDSTKTEKVPDFITVAAATDEHPAQVAKVDKVEVVGLFTMQRWSGMISPARKSELLKRIDALLQATKQARQRANGIEASNRKLGAALLDHING